MNESENSWSIEELVTQMELMQEEINSLNQQLRQKEELIQTLSSEKSDLQSVLLTLKSQLQEKSEQIVKMKGADLILRENEHLKEKDRQRENRLNEIKRSAEAEVRASKEEYSRKKHLLEYYTALRKQNAEDLERKINEQDKLIEESAKKKNKMYQTNLEKIYRKKQKEQNAAYLARNAALSTRLFHSILYAAIVTLLAAVKSERFLLDLEQFITKAGKLMINYVSITMQAGMKASKICDQISNLYVQDVISQLITIAIAAILIILPVIMICYLLKKYIEWYKKEICDNISLWASVIPLALTVFLSEEIHGLIHINLIIVNLTAHLIYTGIRAYVRGCRKNRGYN